MKILPPLSELQQQNVVDRLEQVLNTMYTNAKKLPRHEI